MLAETCLALIIYFEARGEPIDGKLAVADVVLARKKSSRWPNDICSIMKQEKQFSFYNNYNNISIKDDASFNSALIISKHILEGYEPNIVNANHYHTTDIRPIWSFKMKEVRTIGNHKFLRY